MDESEKEHQGGRLAKNFRKANIAEGLCIQLFRPFAAVAPVPREEDFGIDFIGTLLKPAGRALSAQESFLVQIKTHTAARFSFAGDGIKWLRSLKLPYFPVVVNLDAASVSLYTINTFHHALHPTILQRMDFCVPLDDEDCDGFDDFPLHEPLMQWQFKDALDPAFPNWAFSVLQAAIKIETINFQFGPMWRFLRMAGGPYVFDPASPVTSDLPKVAEVLEIAPGIGPAILETMEHVIGPFVNFVSNRVFPDDRSGALLQLRDSLRKLGFDPDRENRWDEIANDMHENSLR